MLERFRSRWIPGAYHGRGQREVFFEGWYLKLVSQDLEDRWAVIPGIFHHPDPDLAHAFIQVLDGISSQVVYHRYPLEAFASSRSDFDLQVGDSRFWAGGCALEIEGQGQQIHGDLRFENLRPWPIRLFSPGVMGPYGLVPFMQTYHGVLSLDHPIHGNLEINGQKISFEDGRGYIEKDWGQTFPRAYIWLQTNHFPDPGISLTASAATIPWLGNWFRGFLVGFLFEEELYRFTTYLGSEIQELNLSDSHISWTLRGGSRVASSPGFPAYQLVIQAERGTGGLLSSPELEGMTPRILESLTASVSVTLAGLTRTGEVSRILYQGRGNCAGLEVAGSVEEILD